MTPAWASFHPARRTQRSGLGAQGWNPCLNHPLLGSSVACIFTPPGGVLCQAEERAPYCVPELHSLPASTRSQDRVCSGAREAKKRFYRGPSALDDLQGNVRGSEQYRHQGGCLEHKQGLRSRLCNSQGRTGPAHRCAKHGSSDKPHRGKALFSPDALPAKQHTSSARGIPISSHLILPPFSALLAGFATAVPGSICKTVSRVQCSSCALKRVRVKAASRAMSYSTPAIERDPLSNLKEKVRYRPVLSRCTQRLPKCQDITHLLCKQKATS